MNNNTDDIEITSEEPSEKLSVNYGRSVFCVPSSVLPKLKNAKKSDILILLSFLADTDADISSIASSCSVDEATVASALSYWRGTGILTIDDEEDALKAEKASQDIQKQAPKRDRLLETVPHYTSEEIASIISSDRSVSEMIDECQQIFGKVFGQTDSMRIVSVMQYYGLTPEYILTVASHNALKDKKAVAYLVTTIGNFCDAGICDEDKLNSYLMAVAKTATLETKVRALFGIDMNRALSENESRYISSWSEKYGFGIEIITMAYNITVDVTNKASLPYCDAILQKWFEAGLKSESDVAKFIETDKRSREANQKPGTKKKPAGKDCFGTKTFDSEEFVKVSLLRSFATDQELPPQSQGKPKYDPLADKADGGA